MVDDPAERLGERPDRPLRRISNQRGGGFDIVDHGLAREIIGIPDKGASLAGGAVGPEFARQNLFDAFETGDHFLDPRQQHACPKEFRIHFERKERAAPDIRDIGKEDPDAAMDDMEAGNRAGRVPDHATSGTGRIAQECDIVPPEARREPSARGCANLGGEGPGDQPAVRQLSLASFLREKPAEDDPVPRRRRPAIVRPLAARAPDRQALVLICRLPVMVAAAREAGQRLPIDAGLGLVPAIMEKRQKPQHLKFS